MAHGATLAPSEWPARVQAFLQALHGAPVRVSDFRRFPAGMSWITVGFTAHIGQAGGRRHELILRIGDPAGLLAPYRAEPEFRMLRALAGVPGLPLPGVHAYSDDPSVIGAPFLITQRMQGGTPQPWLGDKSGRDEATNRTLGEDFSEALGALHAFDWRASDLASMGEGLTVQNTAQREIARWARHAALHERRSPPLMYYTMRWLVAHAPVAQRLVIVHGDYRVGNFLEQDGRITAILDWELVHLGDPHEDLAWAGARTFAGGSTRVGGLVARDEFHARYEARSGMKVIADHLLYYDVLVQYKMAAMLIGAVRRVEQARASDVRMTSMGFQLAPTLTELTRLLREASVTP